MFVIAVPYHRSYRPSTREQYAWNLYLQQSSGVIGLVWSRDPTPHFIKDIEYLGEWSTPRWTEKELAMNMKWMMVLSGPAHSRPRPAWLSDRIINRLHPSVYSPPSPTTWTERCRGWTETNDLLGTHTWSNSNTSTKSIFAIVSK